MEGIDFGTGNRKVQETYIQRSIYGKKEGLRRKTPKKQTNQPPHKIHNTIFQHKGERKKEKKPNGKKCVMCPEITKSIIHPICIRK